MDLTCSNCFNFLKPLQACFSSRQYTEFQRYPTQPFYADDDAV